MKIVSEIVPERINMQGRKLRGELDSMLRPGFTFD